MNTKELSATLNDTQTKVSDIAKEMGRLEAIEQRLIQQQENLRDGIRDCDRATRLAGVVGVANNALCDRRRLLKRQIDDLNDLLGRKREFTDSEKQ